MHILDLPVELLTAVLSYLRGQDLARVCQTCNFLRDLAMQGPLWQWRCSKEYKLKSNEGWDASYYEIYSKVLVKYGTLVGVWKTTMNCYGGLFNVTYWLGQILVEEYFPAKHIKEPLKSAPWFSISLKNGEVSVKCLLDSSSVPHLDEVKFDQEEIMNGRHTLTTNLICHDMNNQEMEEDHEVFQRWMKKEQVMGMRPDLLKSKWDLTKLQRNLLKLSPLVLPSPKPETVIQPGLFKGSYSEHGTYLLMLSYSDENREIHLTKITGNNIVPAGEISVYVDLRRPMILNRGQQESLQTLKDIESPDLPPESDGHTYFSQPFIIPSQCEVGEDCSDLPKDCKARYHSKGRIAALEYNNPTFVKNHWIMFSEDLFGVLWLDLHLFTCFSRVKEEFEVGNNLCHLQAS